MNRISKLALASSALMIAAAACTGSAGALGPMGATGPAGPKGDKGDPGPVADASISAVVPEFAFLGRDREITISGFLTKWSASTMVAFGKDATESAGITVKKVNAASGTALVVTISVAPTAKTGVHDIVVTDGSQMLTYKGAFHVDPPVALKLQGSTAQGSILLGTAQSLDFETPFDTTSVSANPFAPPTFTNVKINAGAGLTTQVNNVTVESVDFALIADVTAPAGPVNFSLDSGPMGGMTTNFSVPAAFSIAARTPTVLMSGQAATGTIDHGFDSALYSFAPPSAALSIVDLKAGTANTTAAPTLFVLPKSGKFADLVTSGKAATVVTMSTDPYYAIYWDNSGWAGYMFTVTASALAATAVQDGGNNGSGANAQSITGMLPAVIQGGMLTSATDEDWYVFNAAAGDVGKKVHIQTLPGDPRTDTVVDVCTTTVCDSMNPATTSLGGPSADTGYHEDFISTPIAAAGTIYIRIYPSSAFNARHQAYIATVRLE